MLDQNVPNPLAKNPNFHTHKVFAAIGIILIVMVIIGGGIWYFVQSAEDKVGVVDESTVIKTATSSAKISTKSAGKTEKEDLLTYRSETFKYSIDYPKTYTIKTSSGYYNNDKSQPFGVVRLNVQDSGTKFIQGKNGLIIYETFEGSFCDFSGDNVEKCKVEEINVSGQMVKKYIYPAIQAQTYPDGETYTYTSTHKNNALVIFTNFDADQFIKTMTFF